MCRPAAVHLFRTLLVLLAVVLGGCRFSLTGEEPASPAVSPDASSPVPITGGVTATVPSAPRATPAVTTATPGAELVLDAPAPRPAPPASGEQHLTLAGTPTGPLTLDPALVRDAESAFLARQIFRGLVTLDASLAVVPDLAQQVRISADRTVYTFRLRDGLTFHDGRPLTAHDVAYSLERATDPALAEGDGTQLPAWTYLRDIAGAEERMAGQRTDLPGVEVLDDRTLRIRLAAPASDFLVKLSAPPAFVVDQRNVAAGTGWWRRPNGSGPFRLERWDDRVIVLRGFAGYLPSPPVLQEVVIRLGVDALEPMNQYERGQLDVVSVPLWALDRVRASSSPFREQLREQTLFAGTFVMLNPNLSPLDDPAVRCALVHGFDREKVARVSLNGAVRPAHGLVPDGMLGRQWIAHPPPYDPVRAGTTLRALDEPLAFYTAGSGVPVTLKEVYERDFGLSVEVYALEWPDYLADLTARRLPVFVVSWIADYPDPSAFLTTLFHSDSPDNYLGYENTEVDRLLDQAAREPDEDVRAQLFDEAQQRILDDCVVIPLYWDVDYVLVAPRVQGLELTPLGILGLERVWIAG